jgi:flagellar protein FlaF
MFADARQAYDGGTKTSVSGRELEARALTKAARQLEECLRQWESPDRPERLDRAVRLNQQLWTLFQTELARPDHGLPVALRVDLLQLSRFIDRRSFEVLGDPDPAKLEALIRLNRQVADGLRGEAQGA